MVECSCHSPRAGHVKSARKGKKEVLVGWELVVAMVSGGGVGVGERGPQTRGAGGGPRLQTTPVGGQKQRAGG